MTIHEMYGRLAEQQAATEAARLYLHDLVAKLVSRQVRLDQVEPVDGEGGGFRVMPALPEEEAVTGTDPPDG